MNLVELVQSEMMDDDANTDTESRRILDAYDEADDAGKALIDGVLISLCGWSLPTLRKRADVCESDEDAENAQEVSDSDTQP